MPIHRPRAVTSNVTVDATTIGQLREALAYCDANDRAVWVAVIHRLKPLDHAGYDIAVEWSRRSPKFDPADFNRVWQSATADRTGYKAIFADAARNGWKNPGYTPNVTPGDFTALQNQIAAATGQGVSDRRYTLLSGSDLKALPSIEWRIKGILPARGLGVIYGPSTAGKSFLAIDMACAIAEGREWFGHPAKPAHVIYLALEGHAGIRARVLAWEQQHGRSLPDMLRVILDTFKFKNPVDLAALSTLCPPGCVVIVDTLARAGDSDINNTKDRAELIDAAYVLQRYMNGLIVLVAHTGKEEEKGIAGAKNLFDTLDAVIFVSRPKGSDTRSWETEKVKDGRDDVRHNFRLGVVPVERDEDREDVTSCFIIPEVEATASATRPLSRSSVFALTTFREAANEFGRLDDAGRFIGLHVEDWRKVYSSSAATRFAATASNSQCRTDRECCAMWNTASQSRCSSRSDSPNIDRTLSSEGRGMRRDGMRGALIAPS